MFRLTAFLNIRALGEKIFSDLSETWWMIGLALVGACILSFIWIVLMRFLSGIPWFAAIFSRCFCSQIFTKLIYDGYYSLEVYLNFVSIS